MLLLHVAYYYMLRVKDYDNDKLFNFLLHSRYSTRLVTLLYHHGHVPKIMLTIIFWIPR